MLVASKARLLPLSTAKVSATAATAAATANAAFHVSLPVTDGASPMCFEKEFSVTSMNTMEAELEQLAVFVCKAVLDESRSSPDCGPCFVADEPAQVIVEKQLKKKRPAGSKQSSSKKAKISEGRGGKGAAMMGRRGRGRGRGKCKQVEATSSSEAAEDDAEERELDELFGEPAGGEEMQPKQVPADTMEVLNHEEQVLTESFQRCRVDGKSFADIKLELVNSICCYTVEELQVEAAVRQCL